MFPPPLYCLHYNECDPKKCTALKLNRLNILKIIKKIQGPLKKAIILNPFSQKVLTPDDKQNIIQYGLIVIDCSWNRVLNINNIPLKYSRKLPPLLAANPVNYGKWEKLSSAEAIAAALYITNFKEFSYQILSKFSWGEEFLKLNFQ